MDRVVVVSVVAKAQDFSRVADAARRRYHQVLLLVKGVSGEGPVDGRRTKSQQEGGQAGGWEDAHERHYFALASAGSSAAPPTAQSLAWMASLWLDEGRTALASYELKLAVQLELSTCIHRALITHRSIAVPCVQLIKHTCTLLKVHPAPPSPTPVRQQKHAIMKVAGGAPETARDRDVGWPIQQDQTVARIRVGRPDGQPRAVGRAAGPRQVGPESPEHGGELEGVVLRVCL